MVISTSLARLTDSVHWLRMVTTVVKQSFRMVFGIFRHALNYSPTPHYDGVRSQPVVTWRLRLEPLPAKDFPVCKYASGE
jgi:hypothetical protein